MNITKAVFEISAPNLETCPAATLPEFAFIGRSNVGKSSLVNLLAGQKNLARVSKIPGYTKLINFFAINNSWRLVDLPGYGYAHVARENKAKFNDAVANYLANRPNLYCVFLLIDSSIPPQKIDLEFIQWLGEQETPFELVFTKTDKVKPAQLQKNMELFQESIAGMFENVPEILTCSSVKKNGVQELLRVIDKAMA